DEIGRTGAVDDGQSVCQSLKPEIIRSSLTGLLAFLQDVLDSFPNRGRITLWPLFRKGYGQPGLPRLPNLCVVGALAKSETESEPRLNVGRTSYLNQCPSCIALIFGLFQHF